LILGRASCGWTVASFSLVFIFLLTPFQTAVAISTPSPGQTSSQAQTSAVPYSDYAFSALNSSERITLALLTSDTHDNLTVAGLEGYISQNLIPYDIRRVLLDIGWQNYAVGTVTPEAWVNNWFTACDAMGIQNVLYVGQLTTYGVNSPWVRSAISQDPSVQTYAANGTAVPFLSYDNPDVAIFLEKDLALLQSYYGSHPSWIGIGTGSSADDPYFPSGQSFPSLGYSNLTISNFVNSGYYSSDVNGTGFLPNGQLDLLWSAYKNVQPSIVLSSSQGFTTSSSANVYGNGSLSNYVLMRFNLQANVSSVGVSWFGNEVGKPGPLNMTLYQDRNGSLYTSGVIGTYIAGASFFNNVTGWQSFPTVSLNLTAGYYWVKFSSPSSDKSDFYQIYLRDQSRDGLEALAWETYVGYGYQHGSTILWLRNQVGAAVGVYPYQQVLFDNPNPQEFVANRTFSFNSVFLYISDRIYDTTNGTLTVEDLTDNDTILASGILSQELIHGVEGWTPIALNKTVTTIPGHVYGLLIREPGGGYSWAVALRGVYTNPPSAGFQGQGAYWLFHLAFLELGQGILDWEDETTSGSDAVTAGYMNAIRIVPSSNSTLESVTILMANNFQTGNYSSGGMSVSVWNSTESGATPSSPLSTGVTVPARLVPANGWLEFKGLSQPVVMGKYYWVVFSANSNESFSMARFTNSYKFDIQVSQDGGHNWHEPREGPTDFEFIVSLSNQQIGSFVSGRPEVQIGQLGYFAEPFSAAQSEQIDGVYLQVIGGCTPIVSLNRDTGSGYPSLSPIASGIYNDPNSGTQDFVQFSSVADLQEGHEYWLVIHPEAGTCNLLPLVYLPSAPGVPRNSSSIVSENLGHTWKNISNSTSTLIYQLASPGKPLPILNTSELSGYLLAYHNQSVSEGVVRGWTGYIDASELSLFGQVASWLSNETDRNYAFYGPGQTNVLNQVQTQGMVIIPTSVRSDSCDGLLRNLEAEMPIAGVQYLDVSDVGLLKSCAGTTLGIDLQQLSYMLGTGPVYGQSSSTRIIVAGDAAADNLTRFLSIAYNASYTQIGLDPTLGGVGALSKFAALVWTAKENPFASVVAPQLLNYVRSGGTLIYAQFGGNRSNLQSVSATAPSDNSSLVSPEQPYLRTLLLHTSFGNLTLGKNTTEIQGDSSKVSLLVRAYGKGEIFLAWFGTSQLDQTSDPVVLLSNEISIAAGIPAPFWYGSSASGPDELFGLFNEGGGRILVWVENAGDRETPFSLHLNSSYYGLGSTWKSLNMNNMNVRIGMGSEIVIDGNLSAGSWMPVYVVPYTSNALIDYGSVQVTHQYVYPHQSFFSLETVKGQTVLLLVSSNSTAAQILINDNYSIPSTRTGADFSNTSEGWVYYNSTGTLLVKYVSQGAGSLRLLAYTPPLIPPEVLPERTLLVVLIALICVELVTLTLVNYAGGSKRLDGKSSRQSSGYL